MLIYLSLQSRVFFFEGQLIRDFKEAKVRYGLAMMLGSGRGHLLGFSISFLMHVLVSSGKEGNEWGGG